MNIEEHVKLAPYTTFKIGGTARYFVRLEESADVAKAVEFSKTNHIPLVVLGGGSNVLLSDDDFAGLLAKMDILGVEFEEKGAVTLVTAGAGESWDELVARTVEKNLYGLENLSGIPGTVGGAPVQNIGAYGAQVADVIEWVEVFDPEKSALCKLTNRECTFGYRDSYFKHDGAPLIIVRVAFALKKNGRVNISYKDLQDHFGKKSSTAPTLSAVRQAVLEIRRGKFPDLSRTGTAGSFFKNPVVSKKVYDQLHKRYPDMPSFPAEDGKIKLPLAWIIDRVCKLKNLRVGDATVSPKQALVICNEGRAKAGDVLALAQQITDAVKTETGIDIEPEVRFIGFE